MPSVKAVVDPELKDVASTLDRDMDIVPLGISSFIFTWASVKNEGMNFIPLVTKIKLKVPSSFFSYLEYDHYCALTHLPHFLRETQILEDTAKAPEEEKATLKKCPQLDITKVRFPTQCVVQVEHSPREAT